MTYCKLHLSITFDWCIPMYPTKLELKSNYKEPCRPSYEYFFHAVHQHLRSVSFRTNFRNSSERCVKVFVYLFHLLVYDQCSNRTTRNHADPATNTFSMQYTNIYVPWAFGQTFVIVRKGVSRSLFTWLIHILVYDQCSNRTTRNHADPATNTFSMQ